MRDCARVCGNMASYLVCASKGDSEQAMQRVLTRHYEIVIVKWSYAAKKASTTMQWLQIMYRHSIVFLLN